MKFQLELLFKSTEKISYRDAVFLTGSCFAENIGQKFREAKFNTIVNPYGILFNPHSIAVSIREILAKRNYTNDDLFSDQELWHSIKHHGCFSSANKNKTVEDINSEILNAHTQLKRKGWMIITFGSAFAFKLKRTGEIVANCHKLPSSEFEKVFLKSDSIIDEWKEILQLLGNFNPQLKILFTISPVRYVRDGLIENNKSKAALINAVHELCSDNSAIYFPAYEYVNDVLRDYRFFKEDMVHPTEQAIDFVWEKFSSAMLDEESIFVLDEIRKFNSFSSHRPIHNPDVHSAAVEVQRNSLKTKFPFLSW